VSELYPYVNLGEPDLAQYGSRIMRRLAEPPDPRISTERPAWLADDQQWRDQLQAMDLDEIRWVERHWDMAGGPKAAVDTSWITYERVGGSVWQLVGILTAVLVVAALIAGAVTWLWWRAAGAT
jgi:hypothetical protein